MGWRLRLLEIEIRVRPALIGTACAGVHTRTRSGTDAFSCYPCLSPHSFSTLLTCFPRLSSLRRSHFLCSFPLFLQSQSGAEQRLATGFPTCVSINDISQRRTHLWVYSSVAEVTEMSPLSVHMTRTLSGSTTVSLHDHLD